MGATKVLLTAEQFDNYPFEEDKRYELDEGELIEMTRPAYSHNRALGRLFVALTNFFDKNPVGEALVSENLYALSASVRRAPDVGIILGDRRAELRDSKVIHVIPDIAVEVLSPSEATRSIHRKLHQYFDAGVKEVWLVYLETREVELWTGPRLPTLEFAGDSTLISALLPGFEIPLEVLFS